MMPGSMNDERRIVIIQQVCHILRHGVKWNALANNSGQFGISAPVYLPNVAF